MEITVAKKDLLKLVTRMQGVAERKSTMPVLSNVLLAVDGPSALRISATDLYLAIAGKIGAEVNKGGSIAVPAKDLFERIKMMPDGHFLRLKDIARVELGSKNSDLDSEVDRLATASLAVFQLPDANALECADRVMAKMDELKKNFPAGLDYVVRYNTTPYIRESIWEVFNTLRDAVILVGIVVLLFLQNWRSAVKIGRAHV